MKQGKFHKDKEREIRVGDEREREREREMNPVVARGGWLMVVEKWREDEHERVFFFLEKRRGFGESVFFSVKYGQIMGLTLF